MRTPQQKAIRQARYKRFRDLGFTPQEARRLRDRSPQRERDVLFVERQRIEERQPERRQVIRQIERRIQELPAPEPPKRIRPTDRLDLPDSLDFIPRRLQGTHSSNLQNFRQWSNTNIGFPPDIQSFIWNINRRTGRLRNNSYGYRVFYRMYVQGRDLDDAVGEVRLMIRDEIGSP
jgi:DNA-binding transcriptional MerR regulator